MFTLPSVYSYSASNTLKTKVETHRGGTNNLGKNAKKNVHTVTKAWRQSRVPRGISHNRLPRPTAPSLKNIARARTCRPFETSPHRHEKPVLHRTRRPLFTSYDVRRGFQVVVFTSKQTITGSKTTIRPHPASTTSWKAQDKARRWAIEAMTVQLQAITEIVVTRGSRRSCTCSNTPVLRISDRNNFL